MHPPLHQAVLVDALAAAGLVRVAPVLGQHWHLPLPLPTWLLGWHSLAWLVPNHRCVDLVLCWALAGGGCEDGVVVAAGEAPADWGDAVAGMQAGGGLYPCTGHVIVMMREQGRALGGVECKSRFLSTGRCWQQPDQPQGWQLIP